MIESSLLHCDNKIKSMTSLMSRKVDMLNEISVVEKREELL